LNYGKVAFPIYPLITTEAWFLEISCQKGVLCTNKLEGFAKRDIPANAALT